MKQRSAIREPAAAIYETIRQYVVGQIAKAGESPKRLISNEELARQFGVTRPTVVKALKELIAEGSLVVRPGIGTFTNPDRNRMPDRARIVALIGGSGKSVFHARAHWQISAHLSEAIQGRSERNLLQPCFLAGGVDTVASELASRGIDGAVWIPYGDTPASAIQSLRKAGMPVVSATREIAGVSSFGYDFTADNRLVAERMLAEGRTRIMLVLPATWVGAQAEQAIAGVAEAHRGRGLAFDRNWIVTDAVDERRSFARTLSLVRPDGLIFNCHISPFWRDIAANVDIAQGCRLFTGEHSVHRDMGYAGYVGVYDWAAMAEQVADTLDAQFGSPGEAPVVNAAIRMGLELRTR